MLYFTWGRFNPPHIGHEMLIDHMIIEAQKNNSVASIFMSKSMDKKNPISYENKLKYMRYIWPDNIEDIIDCRNIISTLVHINKIHKEITFVIGEDRLEEFTKLFYKYNNKLYQFDKINVLSSGKRSKDSKNIIERSSSTNMRLCVSNDDKEAFTSFLPEKLKIFSEEIYKEVKNGIGQRSK